MVKQIDPAGIQALALDLDGTALLPGAALGGRTERALRACLSRGVQIILCTGRAPESAERFRRPLEARGPMVYFNGALVADMPGGGVLKAPLLDREALDFCVDISRRMDVYFQVFFPGPAHPHDIQSTLMAERRCAEREQYQSHTGLQAAIGDLKQAAAQNPRGCIKGMFIAAPGIIGGIQSKLQDRFGGGIYAARSAPSFLEVLRAGVSKGEGLKTALAYRGIDAAAALALGDEENDLPLFKAAGWSAAPSSAREAVRNAADYVFGANAEEGLAAFLETLFGPGA
jgi:Cof subfamily protein (haloacid dehalogenase superfamily)